MKRYLPFVIIALVALLAIGAGAMLYRAKRHPLPAAGDSSAFVGRAEDKTAHVRGGANAIVTLEEFGDFQCPSCSLAAEAIFKVEKDYGPRLRVIFRNFPLKMHSHSLEAAIAAEAAGAQGRFWEMHAALYRNQDAWSKAIVVEPIFESYAERIGCDVERFKKDFRSPEVNRRVAADGELGMSRGVKNTPTIFINGLEIPPPFTRESLTGAIEAMIDANKKS